MSAVADFEPLYPAEETVRAQLKDGDFDRLGDGSRPEQEDHARIVRGNFVRFLLLGGDDTCRPHEKGVRISGAWIKGVLDLEGCRIPRDIGLKDCRFEAVPILRAAIIDNLLLDGSALPGLQADALEARGGVYVRGSMISGAVRLDGSRLGGNFEGDGASIEWSRNSALEAKGLQARGFYLRGARVSGGIDLVGARLSASLDGTGIKLEYPDNVAVNADDIEVRGNVALRGAHIDGEIRLMGARIGGDLDCTAASLNQPTGGALQINRAVVQGAFFLRQGAQIRGALDMTGAVIGAIHDEENCWPGKGDLLLNRCLYGAFIGGPVDARSRLNWLARQAPERWGMDFWPQPYEQLATVFREMGHNEDSIAVLVEKERLARRARRARSSSPLWRAVLAMKDGVLGSTLGYGRRPLFAFVWLTLFWVTGVAVFAFAEHRAAFKPNSPVVRRSNEWTMCGVESSEERFIPSVQQQFRGRAANGQSQLSCFREQPEALSYPVFNPWMYSLDTLFPVLEVGQKEYWRPDPSKPWGAFATWYFYFQAVVGWVLSLLAVAGFSGVVKSR